MRSAFFGNLDQSLPGDFALQNPTMLRVRLGGELLARPGTMVACQGQVSVDLPPPPRRGQNPIGALMRCRGQGLVFMAANGRSVHLFYLENEGLTISGDALLAFAPTMGHQVQPTQDDYITTVHGTGWVAVTTHGTPVLLDTGRAPTFVDAPSAVCWSPDLQIGVNPEGRGGQALQLVLQGRGSVLVEAGER